MREGIETRTNFTIKKFNKNAVKILDCKDSKKLNGVNILKFFPDFLVPKALEML